MPLLADIILGVVLMSTAGAGLIVKRNTDDFLRKMLGDMLFKVFGIVFLVYVLMIFVGYQFNRLMEVI